MNQILYVKEDYEKKKGSKSITKLISKRGITLISSLLVMTGITVCSFGISSWNITHAKKSSDEILQKNLSQENRQYNEIEETNIRENVEKNNQEKEVLQVIKLPTNKQTEENKEDETTKTVTKKVKASNGKSYDTIATLSIPSLNIEYPVLSKTSDALLKISLNKYWGPNPNEVGNLCIVGHNYNDSRFFGKLNKIKKGAEIKLTDNSGKTLTYKVYHTETIDPYDTKCTSQLTNGNIEITLITCNYDGSKRFVVKARN